MAYIYILKNKVNNKLYVGQTTNIIKRFSSHKKSKSSQIISRAIRKHGWDNFIKYVYLCPKCLLDFIEKFLIKIFKATDSSCGYNIYSGGNKNKKYSEEFKEKLSEVHKGQFAGEKHPMYGKHHSEESKKKMSETQLKNPSKYWLGKHHSDATKIKMSENRKGKFSGKDSPFYGTHRSDKTKKKIGKANKGRKSKLAKKVICVDTGKIFDSILAASKYIGCSENSIGNCCRGKTKTGAGYHWMFYDEYLMMYKNDQEVA
jgi:hypothetical protein